MFDYFNVLVRNNSGKICQYNIIYWILLIFPEKGGRNCLIIALCVVNFVGIGNICVVWVVFYSQQSPQRWEWVLSALLCNSKQPSMWGQRSFPVPPPSWEWTVCRGGAGWYDGGEIQDSFYWREAKRGSWNELARLSPCLNGQKRLLCKV